MPENCAPPLPLAGQNLPAISRFPSRPREKVCLGLHASPRADPQAVRAASEQRYRSRSASSALFGEGSVVLSNLVPPQLTPHPHPLAIPVLRDNPTKQRNGGRQTKPRQAGPRRSSKAPGERLAEWLRHATIFPVVLSHVLQTRFCSAASVPLLLHASILNQRNVFGGTLSHDRCRLGSSTNRENPSRLWSSPRLLFPRSRMLGASK